MESYITSIGIAHPSHQISQEEALEFMSRTLTLDTRGRRSIQALYRSSGIKNRYSVLEDYKKNIGEFTFFPNTRDLMPFPSVDKRMKVYEKCATEIAIEAVRNCLDTRRADEITHLITVSCTGMVAPGIDILIAKAIGLSTSVKRTCINFMGCYASINALRMADSVCRSNTEAKVLIVSVELCSLHFQKELTPDNLLSNAIFGDGAAAVLVEGNTVASEGMLLHSFYCDLLYEGEQEMAWRISEHGFEMTLSSYVPKMLEEGIQMLLDNLFNALEIDRSSIDLYAIHPGGKKILEAVEKALGINSIDNRYAYEVLSEYGNMSSVSILFVLYKIWKHRSEYKDHSNILSFAFGPGLTIESMTLRLVQDLKGGRGQMKQRERVKAG